MINHTVATVYYPLTTQHLGTLIFGWMNRFKELWILNFSSSEDHQGVLWAWLRRKKRSERWKSEIDTILSHCKYGRTGNTTEEGTTESSLNCMLWQGTATYKGVLSSPTIAEYIKVLTYLWISSSPWKGINTWPFYHYKKIEDKAPR